MGCLDFWDTLVFTLHSETQNFIVMIANKNFSMDALIDLAMTKLFLLAEYVCSKCSSVVDEPTVSQKVAQTIRFSEKDYVEGELFSE